MLVVQIARCCRKRSNYCGSPLLESVQSKLHLKGQVDFAEEIRDLHGCGKCFHKDSRVEIWNLKNMS